MALVHLNYRSKYLCGDTDVHIVLPELPPDVEPKDFYSSGRKYPVLWLLHGSGGDSSAWIRQSNILTYAMKKQVLALRAIFHFCNIGTPFLIYGVGCEFSVQNILGSYFRGGSLVSRTLSADDSKQTDNMNQTIEPFQIVLLFMGSVVLVRNSAVAIGSVVFGVDQANIMQQSFVLKFAAALGAVCPFIVTGTIQVQNVTNFGYCISLFVHFLNANVWNVYL